MYVSVCNCLLFVIILALGITVVTYEEHEHPDGADLSPGEYGPNPDPEFAYDFQNLMWTS